jgi:U2 small nuclear ribonucleoprotein B''
MGDAGVNQTLYVRNLDERTHVDRMKLMLYAVFSRYGSVLDVVCNRRLAARGQAWIAFRDAAQAVEARKAMQGKELFGKEMDIHFAKAKSDVVARADGTFKPRPKRAAPENGNGKAAQAGEAGEGKSKKARVEAATGTASDAGSRSAPAAAANRAQVETPNPPNQVLFAEGLPADITSEALDLLFKQYTGFVATRMVAPRRIAFVDFDSTGNATLAKIGLDGFKLDATHLLKLSFAKK